MNGIHNAQSREREQQSEARLVPEQPAEEGKNGSAESPQIPAGLWKKCNKCGKPIYTEDVKANFYICPKCGGYFRIGAYKRIRMIVDPGTFVEWDVEMEVSNPLDFPGYEKKLEAAREKTKLNEAIVTGRAMIGGHSAVIGVCDSRFLMSSMGHNVGEKITRAVERATKEKLPVILFACSGGARMQEGMISLMQMAKTSAALKRHHDAGQLFVSVLTDPTTGGVTASFAMVGDIILAEPGALIGFAGPRVIEQTIGQKLPEGFQRSEFLLEHGFVDKIVPRGEMKQTLALILKLHAKRSGRSKNENKTEKSQEIKGVAKLKNPDVYINEEYIFFTFEAEENMKTVEFIFNGQNFLMNTDTFGTTKVVKYRVKMVNGWNYLKLIGTTESGVKNETVWKYEYKPQQ